MSPGRRLARAPAVLFAALLLAGCALASVGQGPPAEIYVLTAPEPALPGAAAANVQILVEQPDTPAEIDSNRIVFQPTPNEIQYFAAAQWADRAPDMVQRLIVETLDSTDKFLSVSRASAGRRYDYALAGELRTFAAMPGEGGGDVVRVALHVKLIDHRSRSIVAARAFEATAQARAARTVEVVRAFDAALGDVLRALAGWTLQAVLDAEERETS